MHWKDALNKFAGEKKKYKASKSIGDITFQTMPQLPRTSIHIVRRGWLDEYNTVSALYAWQADKDIQPSLYLPTAEQYDRE